MISTRYKFSGLMLASGALLSACGGGGGLASFEDLSTRGEALIAEYGGLAPTPADSMPTSGTASYSGVGAYALDRQIAADGSNADLLSNVDMTADFGANTVSGRAYNFRAENNTMIAGEVNMTNGQIVNGNEIRTDLEGTVSLQGYSATISGSSAGMFAGNDAQAAAGTFSALGTDFTGSATITGIWGVAK